MSRALFGLAIATLMTSACTSYRGTDRIHWGVDQNGRDVWTKGSNPSDAVGASRALFIRQLFIGDLIKAQVERTNVDLNRKLVNSGLALIRVNCNEYFNEMGRNQRKSMVFRDMIAPITSAIQTAINLQLFSATEETNQNIVLGFGAFSSAGTSALDIYDRRFLFSSDNIDAVRANTFKALATNAEDTVKNTPDDFVHVVTRLQEMENICMPAAILANVRSSIKTTDFKNDTTDDKTDDDDKTETEKAAAGKSVSDAAQVTTTSQ